MKTREQLIEEAEKILLSDVNKSQKQVLAALTKLLTEFDREGGKIQFNAETTRLINQASKRIYEALNKSGYDSRVKLYLKDFEKIKEAAIAEQKIVNRITVSPRNLTNIQRSAIQQTTNILLGNGLEARYIQPIKDVLLRSAGSGMTISQAELQLRTQLSGGLEAFAETYAKQSILSYDGMLQSRIQKEFDLDGYSFEGSIIKTSSGQCVKWTEMGEIPVSAIEKELDWARDNEGSTYAGHRVAALIEGTTKDNFPINRGHWGCRHSITAIRL